MSMGFDGLSLLFLMEFGPVTNDDNAGNPLSTMLEVSVGWTVKHRCLANIRIGIALSCPVGSRVLAATEDCIGELPPWGRVGSDNRRWIAMATVTADGRATATECAAHRRCAVHERSSTAKVCIRG